MTFVEIVLPEMVPRSEDGPTDDILIPVAARTVMLELFITEKVVLPLPALARLIAAWPALVKVLPVIETSELEVLFALTWMLSEVWVLGSTRAVKLDPLTSVWKLAVFTLSTVM